MEEPTIRYARDPTSQNVVDVQAGILKHKRYECLLCGGKLTACQGNVQTFHFRHVGNDEKAKKCELYYCGCWQDILKEMKISHIEKAEKNKEIRLIIKKRPYGSMFDLYGIIPTMNVLSIDKKDVDDFVQSVKFKSYGFNNEIHASSFLNKTTQALFSLDPSSEKFELDINGDFTIPELKGSWIADPLKDGNIFLGENYLERLTTEKSVAEGDCIWILHKNKPAIKEIYRLSDWYIELIQVNDKIKNRIKKISNIKYDESPLLTDIVLPFDVAPSHTGPIEDNPESKVLISIKPPSDLDPEIEIAPIPLSNNIIIPLIRGTGKTRWINLLIPKDSGERFNISWTDRHRFILLHPNDSKETTIEEKKYGFIISNSSSALIPLWEESIEIIIKKNAKNFHDLGIDLQVPEGLRFNVEPHFAPGSRMKSFIGNEFTVEKLHNESRIWLASNLKLIRFDFGPLGSPIIHFKKERGLEFSDQEIKEKVIKLKPTKITWAVVRKIFDIPYGTRHKDVKISIKHIKKIFKEVEKK